jgi:transposase
MLELVPRQWEVIEHVREKFSCRSCEAITEPPAAALGTCRARVAGAYLGQAMMRSARFVLT